MMWSLALDDERRAAREAGLAEGMAEGLLAGERRKALEAARNFLLNGVDADVVAKSIGLPLDQVLDIQRGLSVS